MIVQFFAYTIPQFYSTEYVFLQIYIIQVIQVNSTKPTNNCKNILRQNIFQNGTYTVYKNRFEAVEKTWTIILASFFIAFGISFLYMLITRWCAGVIVWTALVLYFVAIITLGVLFYNRSVAYKNDGDEDNE
jgi:hypothetical protein